MKRLFLISLLLVPLLTLAVHAEQAKPAGVGKHLFILSGQSNMGGMKPQDTFIPILEAKFGKDNITHGCPVN